MNKKVFVGLSGGVDSSVSAYLLKKTGYDVTGVFIKGYQPDWIPCTWKDDRISAMRTAAHLDIPFVTLDLEMQYKEKVVSYLLKEYAKGNTPNPDMFCNREIKFGSFLTWARKNGADFVATGHYAQNIDFKMFESKDTEKDQTYFLSQLTQKELQHVLFPIGHLEKKEVRKIAAIQNLPVATRKDSQGICFVGDLSMKEFLKKELSPKVGKVVSENGQVVGEHEGAILYTIGERHGFKIFNTSWNQEIFYVVGKDIEKNELIVSVKLKENFSKDIDSELSLKEISFTGKPFNCGDILAVRIRYRGEKIKCEVKDVDCEKQTCVLNFLDRKYEIIYAPGQFAVFYFGEVCLGGGVIY